MQSPAAPVLPTTLSPAAADPALAALTTGPAMQRAGVVLAIDLDALRQNWRTIRDQVGPACLTTAVVKADGYGLGAAPVATALAAAGCRRFFVALPDEALSLRAAVPRMEIAVLNGLFPGVERDFAEHRILPVLNDLGEIEAWAATARRVGRSLGAMLQIDTGMNRLGLSLPELQRLAEDPGRLGGIAVVGVMSHLACADQPEHPLNALQRERFVAARRLLPDAPWSLAASAGILLGAAYHGDFVRPGIALYGGAPRADGSGALAPVARLFGRILQLRAVAAGESVGYGASFVASRPMRIAICAAGYADGYLRALSGRGTALAGGVPVPVIGRVSMDLIALDVSLVAQEHVLPGAWVELIGGGGAEALAAEDGPSGSARAVGLEALARAAGTISYELLTRLGNRCHRRYLEAARP